MAVKMVKFMVDVHDDEFRSLLDMLRYEEGRVLDWNTRGIDRVKVIIECPVSQHAPARWASFGITTTPYDPGYFG
jgi:hypothetical protein